METKTIVCPISKNEIVLKAWITGEEYENIRKPIVDIKMPMDEKGEVNYGDPIKRSTETAVKTVVVSVGGKDKECLKLVRELRKEDYLFVLSEVDKIVKGESFLAQGGKPANGTNLEN